MYSTIFLKYNDVAIGIKLGKPEVQILNRTDEYSPPHMALFNISEKCLLGVTRRK